MSKSIVRRTRPGQRVALGLVVITTIAAIVASGLKAMDDNTYEMLHTLSLVAMLSAYIFFVATLASRRGPSGIHWDPSMENNSFVLHPCTPDQVVTITSVAPSPSLSPKLSAPTLQRVPLQVKSSVRVVIAKNTRVDLNFVKLLASFPNVAALDIQGSIIDPEVWNELAHFDHLHLVLANGAVQASELRDLALTVPEIKVCIEPSLIAIDASRPLQPAA